MSAPVLSISGLTKGFRGRRVVDGVEMTVGQGQIVGFLGPNGAGKTSVMTMVMGLMPPDSGRITLFGQLGPSPAARLRMGYLQEKPSLYPEMTARAYLSLFARLHNVPYPRRRVEEVLDRVGLTQASDRAMGSYSRGMQQRASLARVMLHAPEFLILDEPTLGLDPRGVADMRDIFREMREAGTTLLFSSHQLAEIERVCDTVIFLSQGKVIASGSPVELLPSDALTEGLLVETVEPVDAVKAQLATAAGIADVTASAQHQAVVRLTDPAGTLQDRRANLARILIAAGLTPLSITTRQPSLEDLFLTLAGPRPANGD
jgi:ABC-type multidrug transport system ATPase subunit